MGSGAVHMMGGVAAFMGAWIAGVDSTVCSLCCAIALHQHDSIPQCFIAYLRSLHQLVLCFYIWSAQLCFLPAGPRIGRFDASGKPRELPGHNNVFYIAGVNFFSS